MLGTRLALPVLLAAFGGTPAATLPSDTLLEDPFRQLDELLPTPTDTRNAAGAPGHRYWQQEVDYAIEVTLDDAKQRIVGSEQIRYTNNSPDSLDYLWLQLDANIFSPSSGAAMSATGGSFDRISYTGLERMLARQSFDGSVELTRVASKNKALGYVVVDTMMRVDLPKPLAPGKSFKFDIDWSYAINESKRVGGRTGFERFDDGNIIYEIAQWVPRLAPYDDVNGWQHKQFLGGGEFALEFGDYEVDITVPADHVVTATGVLSNAKKVLSKAQRERLERARRATAAEGPVFIVSPEEAVATAASEPSADTKTWHFSAKQVRDFAFASSRKFIWDAQGVRVGDQDVMAMSLYPIEGEPLWSTYSTRAIVHTLESYSRYTFAYPYPTAISVNGPVGGMEYPMICFNGPRPEEDGTYSKRTKYGLISVIIHEVGHNFFPMIVNSDEREWTWMDEGLNTFMQYLAEQAWETDYPSRRGEPQNIVDYMLSERRVPIMTSADSLVQGGNNAYAKPATALNILRETVLGRELFDKAFATYAQRWQFKRPMPADFFRTMEDASGVDLDWFWRGWFYTTLRVDVGIEGVTTLTLEPPDPQAAKDLRRAEREAEPETLSQRRNTELPKLVDELEGLKDFYNDYDPLDVTPEERASYEELVAGLSDEQEALLAKHPHISVVRFVNLGGLVSPLIVELELADGSREEVRIPAEIWRRNGERVSKLFMTREPVVAVHLDPHLETADVDTANNHYPPRLEPTRFELYEREDRGSKSNPMREAQAREQGEGEAEAEQGGEAAAKAGAGE